MRKKTKERSQSEPIKIGNETIYPLQQKVADDVLAILWSNEKKCTLNKRSAVLAMQPQSGKTGVIIALVDGFIKDCVARKRTFQIIVVCGLPHLDLTDQTRSRLTARVNGSERVGAMLHVFAGQSNLQTYPIDEYTQSGIIISHNNSTLRKMDLNMEVDVRLWVADEVHLGNVRSGNIDIMLQKHGVRICEQIHTWGNSKTVNHFVGVSATPTAHMLKSDNISLDGEALFHWIYEAPPANYNSLVMMRTAGRLKQTKPLFHEDSTPTDFFNEVLTNFKKQCRNHGPGYLVIRATGAKHTQLINHINRRGRNIECLQFDAKEGNIDELNLSLSLKPKEPTYVVIRGSMRAGITLPLNHCIRGWVETESTTSDAQAQAGVGRACGYGRTQDTYFIYCDLVHVDAWIEAYAKLDKGGVPAIPSGVQNKEMSTHKRYGVKEILPYDDAWKKYVGPRVKSGYRTQISKTSGNILNDVAGFFLEGRRDSGSTIGIHVDGPTSDIAVQNFIKKRVGRGSHKSTTAADVWAWQKVHHESYKKLIEAYPHAKGLALIFDEGIKVTRSGQSRNALQRKTSALMSDEGRS